MDKRQELYRGKAKTVYATDDPQRLVMHYRDDVSAFDGVKLAKLERKGSDLFVTALSLDPSAPAVLYAGTHLGVLKSVDSGATWSPLHLAPNSGLPPGGGATPPDKVPHAPVRAAAVTSSPR